MNVVGPCSGQRVDDLAALDYFMKAPPTRLVLRNLKLPVPKYGWKIDAGGMGLNALQAYAPDALIELALGRAGIRGVRLQ